MKSGKVYLHVGLQKTASTFLQKEVFPHAAGLSYVGRPYTQENNAFNALQYADDALYSPAEFAEEVALLRQEADGVPILISDELFSGFPFYGLVNRGQIARRLAEIVPEAEVLLVLRGQVELIESLYNHYVRPGWFSDDLGPGFLHDPGEGMAYQAWLDGARAWNFGSRRFNHRSVFSADHFLYSKSIALYASHFSKVHVLLYEDLKQDAEGTLRRLEHILSTPLPRPTQTRRRPLNASLEEGALRRHIARNRLAAAFPNRGGDVLGRLLARPAVSFTAIQPREARRRYVTKVLQRAGVFEDNRSLNADRNLGMDQHADVYFDPVTSTPPTHQGEGRA